MTRTYATAADYQEYTGQTPPADIDSMLAKAGRFLESNVFRLCWYLADQDTGMPTDQVVLDAFRDATCAQAQWWEELGDSIGATGAGWGEVRIGTVLLNRSVTAVGQEASPARQIAAEVWDVLQSSDLTPDRFRIGEVWTWGWAADRW